MIADCLRDYIGLRGCAADEPLSGLYLTDQPGISLISIDKVADSDKQTYLGVWDSLNKRALNTLATDTIAAFSKRFHLKRLTESVKLPQNVDTTSTTAPSAELRGYSIELQYLSNTTDARSGLQVIHLQEVKMYSAAVVTTDFKIIDVDTSEILETKSVDLVTGWNTIWTEVDLIAYHVFIGYDATAVTSVYLNLPEDDTSPCGCGCLWFCCGDTCGGVIQGGTYDEATETLDTGVNTFGLAGTVSVQCTYETILCNNKSLFKMALFNLLAYELMRERIFTERVNKFTTVDLDKAERMMPEFYAAYQKELQQAVDGIDLNTADCCLVCEAQVQYVETTI